MSEETDCSLLKEVFFFFSLKNILLSTVQGSWVVTGVLSTFRGSLIEQNPGNPAHQRQHTYIASLGQAWGPIDEQDHADGRGLPAGWLLCIED